MAVDENASGLGIVHHAIWRVPPAGLRIILAVDIDVEVVALKVVALPRLRAAFGTLKQGVDRPCYV